MAEFVFSSWEVNGYPLFLRWIPNQLHCRKRCLAPRECSYFHIPGNSNILKNLNKSCSFNLLEYL